jgi:hypothetical protein
LLFIKRKEGSLPILLKRMVGASLLDPATYEDVEADRRATWQAVLIVLCASLAGGLGAGWPDPRNVVFTALLTLVCWLVWAGLTYWIGTHFLPEPQTRSNPGELLRTIGFANSPGLLRVLGLVPFLRPIVLPLAGVWVLVATIVAVRQALDYRGTLRAVVVCTTGWAIQVVFSALGVAALTLSSGPLY